MYPSQAIRASVRDRRSPYGSGGAGGLADSGPASACLFDLPTAEPVDALRIVARFCVLRWLILRHIDADPHLLRHARDAARSHLAGVEPGWPEAEELIHLVDRTEPLGQTVARLWAVARLAEESGHSEGAWGARRTALVLMLEPDAVPGHN